jgi:MFS family permease
VYTAIHDVVEPRMRATAMALFMGGLYLFGGALGPIAVGLLSDHYATTAMLAAGANEMNETFKAEGLHDAMYLIPVALFLSTLALLQASRCFVADTARMSVDIQQNTHIETAPGN